MLSLRYVLFFMNSFMEQLQKYRQSFLPTVMLNYVQQVVLNSTNSTEPPVPSALSVCVFISFPSCVTNYSCINQRFIQSGVEEPWHQFHFKTFGVT